MGDIYFANVSLLLHCDGTDGSTTFTDSSPSAHTVTAVNNAQIDTAQSKFGGASALFDGTSDYLTVPDHADFDLGSGDFTLECWVRWNTKMGLAAFDWLMFKGSASTTYDWRFGTYKDLNSPNTEYVVFHLTTGGTSSTQASTLFACPSDFSTGVWYHIALTRASGTVRAFVDGVQVDTGKTNSGTAYNGTADLYIASDPANSYEVNGWLDDIRITKGVARYTADFTAPAGAFPDSAEFGAAVSSQKNSSGTGWVTESPETLVASASAQKNAATAGILGLIFSLPITIENLYRVELGITIIFKVRSAATIDPLAIIVGEYPVTATLPITLRVYTSPTLPTLPVVIYSNAAVDPPDPSAVADYATWKPRCVLDGTDISAKLIGGIDVEFDEQAAPVASFSFIPAAGTVDPLAWVSKPVRLSQQALVGGVVTQEYLLFTGVVSDPTWSVDDRVLTLSCTGDMQSRYDAMTKAQIATQLASASPTYSSVIFGEPESLSGWEYAESLISTAPYFVWQDAAGSLRCDSILPKVTADYTFADNGRFLGSDIEWPSRMEMLNKLSLSIEYRFARKRSREVLVSFRPWQLETPAVWLGCDGGWDLPQRDQIASAAESGGWYPTSDITYVDVWPNGSYGTRGCSGGFFEAGVSITPEVAETLCIGANWSAARRWMQTVSETATIVVAASESQAVVGILADSESYGYESEYDDEDWEKSLENDAYSVSGMTQMASGDYKLDLDTDRSAWEAAQTVAINKAHNDILRSHRGTTFTFQTTLQPQVDLSHTLHVDCDWVECQGKVRRVTHRLNIDTGDATSEIGLALFRHNGAGIVTDTPVAATDKAADPTETAFERIVRLPMYIGGSDDSPEYEEDWTGYIVNRPAYELASTDPVDRAEMWSRSPSNPAVRIYPEGFHMVYPTIDEDYVDPAEVTAAANFDVAIPEDLLVLISG